MTAHLEAENAYTQERTAHLAELRQAIFDEIKARTRETDLSVPTRNRGHWYYGRSFEGKEYGASCRVPVTDPDDWTPPRPAEDSAPDQPALPGEELLLDLDALADGHEFFSLGGSSISPDSTLLAYSTDVVGDERYTIRVLDLATREHRPDEIVGVIGGATWDPSGEHLYYTTVDESWRSDKIWRHTLGTAQADDELVHHEQDGRFFVGVGRSRSDRFVIIAAGSKITSEYRFLDSQDPDAGFRVFSERREGLEYSLDHAVVGGEDVFLVLHNDAGADFELGTAPIAPTAPDGLDAAGRARPRRTPRGRRRVRRPPGRAPAQRGADPAPHPRARDGTDRQVGEDYLVEFDHEVYTVGSGGNPSFAQPTVRLGYTTMAVPSSVYDYDVRTRELTLLRRAPVLGGYEPGDYEEHRLWATAEDGERVPISIVCRRGARDARTRSRRCSTATAPTRPRSTRTSRSPGSPCSTAGRRSRSRTCAAAARWAGAGTTTGSCSPSSTRSPTSSPAAGTSSRPAGPRRETLVAEGASAGGLLMGAVANQAPELFGGILAGVPFVDILTTMLDATLPLTVTEYDEWGNPEARPGDLRLHRVLRALRQRRRDDLPADPGRDLAQRHPGALRRARQVGRQAAGDRAQRRGRAAAHRDVGRPRRGLRAATSPGTTGPSRWPGSWTGWGSPTWFRSHPVAPRRRTTDREPPVRASPEKSLRVLSPCNYRGPARTSVKAKGPR